MTTATNKDQSQNRPGSFWDLPWGYPHALLLTASLFINGLLLQAVSSVMTVSLPGWPFNGILLACYILLLCQLAFFSKRFKFLDWLASAPVSVATLSFIGLLCVMAGVFPQKGPGWLHNIIGSWPFVMELILVLTNLGLALIRRVINFQPKDTGFVLNHLGVWLILAGMAFGQGDLLNLKLTVQEGEKTRTAYTIDALNHARPYPLPFDIGLLDFRMEEYPPKLTYIKSDTGLFPGRKPKTVEISLEQPVSLYRWTIKTENYLPEAQKVSNLYQSASNSQAVPAAYIKVSDRKSGKLLSEGWVSGSRGIQYPETLDLGEFSIVILDPKPSLFASDLVLFSNGKELSNTILVNKPLRFQGWTIYQSSYDSAKGKYSEISVLDIVKDPWLPVVFIGALFMMAGTALLFYTGIRSAA